MRPKQMLDAISIFDGRPKKVQTVSCDSLEVLEARRETVAIGSVLSAGR
jgi:hypothetical protein